MAAAAIASGFSGAGSLYGNSYQPVQRNIRTTVGIPRDANYDGRLIEQGVNISSNQLTGVIVRNSHAEPGLSAETMRNTAAGLYMLSVMIEAPHPQGRGIELFAKVIEVPYGTIKVQVVRALRYEVGEVPHNVMPPIAQQKSASYEVKSKLLGAAYAFDMHSVELGELGRIIVAVLAARVVNAMYEAVLAMATQEIMNAFKPIHELPPLSPYEMAISERADALREKVAMMRGFLCGLSFKRINDTMAVIAAALGGELGQMVMLLPRSVGLDLGSFTPGPKTHSFGPTMARSAVGKPELYTPYGDTQFGDNKFKIEFYDNHQPGCRLITTRTWRGLIPMVACMSTTGPADRAAVEIPTVDPCRPWHRIKPSDAIGLCGLFVPPARMGIGQTFAFVVSETTFNNAGQPVTKDDSNWRDAFVYGADSSAMMWTTHMSRTTQAPELTTVLGDMLLGQSSDVWRNLVQQITQQNLFMPNLAEKLETEIDNAAARGYRVPGAGARGTVGWTDRYVPWDSTIDMQPYSVVRKAIKSLLLSLCAPHADVVDLKNNVDAIAHRYLLMSCSDEFEAEILTHPTNDRLNLKAGYTAAELAFGPRMLPVARLVMCVLGRLIVTEENARHLEGLQVVLPLEFVVVRQIVKECCGALVGFEDCGVTYTQTLCTYRVTDPAHAEVGVILRKYVGCCGNLRGLVIPGVYIPVVSIQNSIVGHDRVPFPASELNNSTFQGDYTALFTGPPGTADAVIEDLTTHPDMPMTYRRLVQLMPKVFGSEKEMYEVCRHVSAAAGSNMVTAYVGERQTRPAYALCDPVCYRRLAWDCDTHTIRVEETIKSPLWGDQEDPERLRATITSQLVANPP
jgi:hypothetical protein